MSDQLSATASPARRPHAGQVLTDLISRDGLDPDGAQEAAEVAEVAEVGRDGDFNVTAAETARESPAPARSHPAATGEQGGAIRCAWPRTRKREPKIANSSWQRIVRKMTRADLEGQMQPGENQLLPGESVRVLIL